jgi:hypothetical protein
MSLPRLWSFLAVALPVLAAVIANLPTVDLAYHLRAGGMILDTRAIPATDTFTFTAAGLPWQDQQWGAQFVLAAVFRLAGWTGLVLLRATLIGLMFGLVFDLCRRGHAARTAALLTLAAFGLASVTLGLRPQLFGMVLFAATLWVVARRHDRPRLLWLAVPLATLWANAHGSFILAPALAGLAWLEDLVERQPAPDVRRSFLATVAVHAATLVNPFGAGVWGYAVGISTNGVVTGRITEWQPTTVRTPEGAAFFISVALIVVLLVALARRGRAVPPTALLWLVPFAGIAAWAVRGLAWWPLVAAPTVARLTARAEGDPARREALGSPLLRRLNVVVAAAIVLTGVALLPLWRSDDPGLRAPAGVVGTAPPGITGALRDLVAPGDRLFAPQPWASWFELEVPQAQLFVDSRIELFPVAVWDDYDTITDGFDGWRDTLEQWDVTLIVTAEDLGRSPLDARLAGDPAWYEVFADKDGRVYARTDRRR